jgi:uncharacterized protein involved in exopolysaccharide biosynthesis
VNTVALLKQLFKYKWAILFTGIIFFIVASLYAKTIRPTYTSRATLFPLTDQSSGNAASGLLSSILGDAAGNVSSNFSTDANVNIIELALSRNVREKVAASRVPQFNNKTVTELLVQEINAHKSFFTKDVDVPQDSVQSAVLGGVLLNAGIAAKINKNGLLELNYSDKDPALVQPISELLISAISQFYIDLRTKKALVDYQFTLKKIDSLESAINDIDNKAISYESSTYFTPSNKLKYQLPQDNISRSKQRLASEENMQLGNKEAALWTLQKATPIIEPLDSPTPPFAVSGPSTTTYGILGFAIGIMIAAFFAVRKSLVNYYKTELQKLMQ